MDILEKLFGGAARVKLMKLFLFNSEDIFDKKEIQKRTKISSQTTLKELNLLEKAKFIRKKSFFQDRKVLRSGKDGKKKRVYGYILDKQFPFILPMQKMLVDSGTSGHSAVVSKLQRVGKIKMITVAGIFIQDEDSRIDLLIVGDDLNPGKIRSTIGILESEMGKQLRYSVFDTNDFKYRLGICDRLVRDIFDFPHETLVDRIGL